VFSPFFKKSYLIMQLFNKKLSFTVLEVFEIVGREQILANNTLIPVAESFVI